jgi:hypothetical protein
MSAANSTQELISLLPFASRTTRFAVVSGVNNFTCAIADPLDPLFGPSFFDYWLQKLQNVWVEDLVRLEWTARKGRAAPKLRSAGQPRRRTKHAAPPDPDQIVANAAALQLRDLGALRRLVPDEAEVLFALQPIALKVDKELTEEETELFEVLDVLQELGRWAFIKELVQTRWRDFAAQLADGCAKLGVPFVDLGDAPYTGWCFLDRIHMNDRGNEIAAGFLHDAWP